MLTYHCYKDSRTKVISVKSIARLARVVHVFLKRHDFSKFIYLTYLKKILTQYDILGRLLEKFRIAYSDELKISNPSLFDQMDQEVLKKFDAVNNCLQVLVLKSKDVNEILVVANTHLYFQPEADQVRYLQSLAAIIFLENQCIQLKKQVGFFKDVSPLLGY